MKGPLPNPKHEAFCQAYAQLRNGARAYIAAGYEVKDTDVAAAAAARLLSAVKVKNRVLELQTRIERQVLAGIVKLEIRDRNARVTALQSRWDKMRTVIEERAADPTMADVPGGSTGLLVRERRKVGAEVVDEYAVDVGLLKELRAHEQQAAQELGQWTERQEHTGTVGVFHATEAQARLRAFNEADPEGFRAYLEGARKLAALPLPEMNNEETYDE